MNIAQSSVNTLLRSSVYEYLREELRQGRMTPGMSVSLNQLAESLEISRTPLRDAILQLQAEGFVTLLPQRGIKINDLTAKDIQDSYQIIGALDSTVLFSVFDLIGPAEIARMKEINDEMRNSAKRFETFRYFELNTKFHTVYLDLSTNEALLKQLNIVRQRLFGFANKDWSKIVELNYQEHLNLLALIEEGKGKEAADYMRDTHCVLDPGVLSAIG
jgi:DNA-binding GntR family transcriptional regulator